MKKEKVFEINNVYLTYRFLKKDSFKNKICSFLKLKNKIKNERNQYNALKGVSFSLERGDVLGIIGNNGAGKSTLLRVMGNILRPDKGDIQTFNNRVALLALGAGFENELSGRENIYLNGLLLGFSKKEIEQKIDEILEFSELSDFIDAPIKTYSSGMKSRLKFSIAININPDILLIDEVLSVGDKEFKKKSNEAIQKIIKSGKTVVIVSHSIGTLEKMCNKVLWLEKGKVIEFGDTKKILENYKK